MWHGSNSQNHEFELEATESRTTNSFKKGRKLIVKNKRTIIAPEFFPIPLPNISQGWENAEKKIEFYFFFS